MKSREFLLGLSRNLLKEGKSIRFQAKGWSMRPFIKDGDFIIVSPVENFSFGAGDVVLYLTSENQVIVHRILKKYTKDGRIVLLIKGDAAFGSADEVDVQNILGKVTAIERMGRKRRIDTRLHYLIGVILAGISPFSHWIYPSGSLLKQIGSRIIGGVLEKLQGLKLYTVVAKKLLKEDVHYKMVSLDEAYSLSPHYSDLQRPGTESSKKASKERIERIEDSDFCFVARKKRRIIGAATLNEFPKSHIPYEGWWIFGLWVNWRYRGLGIGEKLVKMVIKKAVEDGASNIKLLVFNDAKRARNLYQKMGFRHISIPELDKQLEEEARMTLRRRIILAKDLQSS